jgi:hypothetical protein
MNLPGDLNSLSPEQLRALAAQLIVQVQDRDREIEEKTREVEENECELHYRQTRIEQLSHEISILKRQQFGRHSEQFTSEQMSLLDEAIDADLAAIELELEQLQPETSADHSRQQPKRTSLPAQLPRTEIRHEELLTRYAISSYKTGSGLRRAVFHFLARAGCQPTGAKVLQRLRSSPQHDSCQRLPLLRGGQRNRAGGTRRVTGPGNPWATRVHRHREGQTLRTRRTHEEDPGRRSAVGNATAQAIAFRTRIKEAYYYLNSAWFTNMPGGSYEFLLQPGVRDLDARVPMHYYATGITPAMIKKMIGAGSQYAAKTTDSKGKPLNGGRTDKIHLPSNVPAKDFWSFTVYDNQTRSMLQTGQQFPSVNGTDKGAVINPDGSVDVWFSPILPKGVSKANWVQTIPGKGWKVLFRLYGALEPWFDKTWRPAEFVAMQ